MIIIHFIMIVYRISNDGWDEIEADVDSKYVWGRGGGIVILS